MSIHGAQLQVRLAIFCALYPLSALIKKLEGILGRPLLLYLLLLYLLLLIAIVSLSLVLSPKLVISIAIDGFGWTGEQRFAWGTS